MKKNKQILSILAFIILASNQVYSETIVDKTKENKTSVIDMDGLSVINIDTPSKEGVSFNEFTKFNVENKGTVINNSDTDYIISTGTKISANENLKEREADIAVLKVTGNEKTNLNSLLEAATEKDLKVYIANKNGISVDNFDVHNIKNLVLTTGEIDKNLDLSINQGKIIFHGDAFKGSKELHILAERVTNQGKISADTSIDIKIGKLDLDKDLRLVRYRESGDRLNLLGSLYSNQINIFSTPNVDIETKEVLAKGDINIHSLGKLINRQAIRSNSKVTINAKEVLNQGNVTFEGNFYEKKWITADGKVLSEEEVKEKWNKTETTKLTSKDTWLPLTGTLLSQWAYDEEHVKKNVPGNVLKRFNDVLEETNKKDEYTVLTRDGKQLVLDKQKNKTFVNKGDIYATEVNDKRVLEAVAVSKILADQAVIQGDNVVITAEKVSNMDGKIKGDSSLIINSNKLTSSNTLSGDVKLQDGYEHIDWDLELLYYRNRPYDTKYVITYNRGLKSEDQARKVKVGALNSSVIEGANVTLNVNEVYLEDKASVDAALKSTNKLTINSDKVVMNTQSIKANNADINAKNLELKNALISANILNINSQKVELLNKKEVEEIIKRENETLTREYIRGSAFDVSDSINISSDSILLNGGIIRSKNKANISSKNLSVVADKVNKDYKSVYDISKTYRKINHTEKIQKSVPSFIISNNLTVNAEKLNTSGSHLLGINSLNINSKNTAIDVTRLKNEVNKRYGIDNGWLGENYKKVKLEEDKALGSTVVSEKDLYATIEEELKVIGSKLKGEKVVIKAKDIDVSSATSTVISDSESRNLLAGDLNGTVNEIKAKDSISYKVDMEIYKKEKNTTKIETNKESFIEGKVISIKAEDKANITGSNVKADKVDINAKEVNIEANKTENTSDTVSNTHSVSVNVTAGATKRENTVNGGLTYTVSNSTENKKEEKLNSSTVSGTDVNIKADNVNIDSSTVSGKNVKIEAKEEVNITSSKENKEYTKNSDEVSVGMKANVKETNLTIIGELKALIDERDKMLSYALNPVGAYAHYKEVKTNLKNNYEKIKKLVENIKNKNIKPETLGIAINIEGDITYNKKYINRIAEDIKKAEIKGENVTIISGDKVTLNGSNLEADIVTIYAKDLELNSSAKHDNTVSVVNKVGVSGKHDILTENTTGGVNIGLNVEGINKKENVNATIKAGEIKVESENIELNGGKITADKGNVTAENITKNSKSDREVKYSINANGSFNSDNTATGNGKANTRVDIENKEKSDITIKDGTVDAKNTKETKETEVNFGLNAETFVKKDKENKVTSTSSTTATTTIDTGKSKVEIGAVGVLKTDGDKTKTNVGLSSNTDVVIPINNSNTGNVNINVNTNTTIDEEGNIVNTVDGNLKTEIDINTSNSNNKIKIDVSGTLENNNDELTKLDGTVNVGGTTTISGSTNNLDGSITINADTTVSGGITTEETASVNVNGNGEVTLKGETENVSGNATLKAEGTFAADNTNGVTKLDGTTTGNGTVTISGESNPVSGNVTINANTTISGGITTEETASVNVNGNGELDLNTSTRIANVNMKLLSDGLISANNKDGISKYLLNEKLDSNIDILGNEVSILQDYTLEKDKESKKHFKGIINKIFGEKPSKLNFKEIIKKFLNKNK